jgi:membrane protein
MKLLGRLSKILSGVQTDVGEDISRIEHCAHFCVLVGKSFVRNRCPVRAAALSYTTLLALIPMLAVAISITSSLLKTQGEQKIYQVIDQVVSSIVPPGTNTVLDAQSADSSASDDSSSNQPPELSAAPPANTAGKTPVVSVNAQKEAAKWIHDFVAKTQSGTLGAVGMLLLVLVAIRMLANVEATFNDIWGVTQGRSWVSRVVLYWTTITLGPLLLAGALGLAGSLHLQATKGLVTSMPIIGSLVFQLLPLVLLWLVFALIYQLVPHTKINFSAALVGGIVGGSLWHLNNLFGFLYASRVVSNSEIYGSLGLVPVFMIGVYFSWLILLFGAQVAYAFQNRRAYLQDKLLENVNQRGREFIALRLMACIGQRFQNGRPLITLPEISADLGIPTRLAQQVLQVLFAAQLVVEVDGEKTSYAPARPLETINAYDILHALRAGGGQTLPMRDEPGRREVLGEFARIEQAERQAASSLTLLALVNRAPVKRELPATSAQKNLLSEPEADVANPLSISPAPPPAAKRPPAMPDDDQTFPL